jgi:5,10-methylenetetrahydrofolate reductase
VEDRLSRLSDAIATGKFLVTAELAPPKGTDISAPIAAAERLKGVVDAFNVTDQQASVMRSSPWALCKALLDRGIEPIMQMTCRDRNRVVMQGDLLAASILGIQNVLCLTGDPPGTGDHPEAKAVNDVDVVSLVALAKQLTTGKDMAGNKLQGAPSLCIGAVANPGAKAQEPEMDKLQKKVAAGAQFIQTQAVYEPRQYANFIGQAPGLGVAMVAGIIFIKSGKQARFMNEKIPGIHVPEALIAEIEGATDKEAASIAIAARIIRELRPMCRGVHMMAMGWEHLIPEALKQAGVR